MKKIALILLTIIFCISCTSSSTLMTFNIRYQNASDKQNSWSYRKEDVISFIKSYNPDILGLQEDVKNTIAELNKSLPKYNYIGVGIDGKTKGEYAAIFYDTTTYQVVDEMTFWLSETPNVPSRGWDASAVRICTYGAFVSKKGKDTLHVFNTHLDRKGRESKEKATELIINKIKELNLLEKNIVFMGDLNSRVTDKNILALNKVLDDAAKISKAPFAGPKGTFNFFNKDYKPAIQIDYIFTKNLKVISYKHLDDRRKNGLWLSDHLPILIEVQH